MGKVTVTSVGRSTGEHLRLAANRQPAWPGGGRTACPGAARLRYQLSCMMPG